MGMRAATAIAALLLSSACVGMLPRLDEGLRVENMNNLDAAKLGFVRGQTRFAQAEASMRAAGLSGISKATFAVDGMPLLNVVAADYQLGVHLFENDSYLESLSLDSGPVLPYGVVVKLVRSRDEVLLLALYRDALETIAAQPPRQPRMLVFARRNGAFVRTDTVSLAELAQRHGGLASPMFVGTDLDEGIILAARDRAGAIWDSAYLVKREGREVRFEPLALEEMAKCPCLAKYLSGASPEEAAE